jgi:hypothetical protein
MSALHGGTIADGVPDVAPQRPSSDTDSFRVWLDHSVQATAPATFEDGQVGVRSRTGAGQRTRVSSTVTPNALAALPE